MGQAADAKVVSKKGHGFWAGRLQAWLITALVAGVALNILFAVIRAYLPLMATLAALAFVGRVLWRITR